jgi:DNA-binding MarR family transcriptional regulator
MNDWHWIAGSDAADALLNPQVFRFFAVFVGQRRTLAEAARRLEVSPTTLRYHVERFAKWGLLSVSPSERNGRTRKVYTAISERLYVPFAVSSLENPEALARETQASLQDEFVADLIAGTLRALPDAERGGIAIHLRAPDVVSVDFTPTPPPEVDILPVMACGLWNSWTTVQLTPEEAHDLELRLRALWDDSLRRSLVPRAHTKPFTLRLGLAPHR